MVFHGETQTQAHAGKGLAHNLPLIVLIILSTFIGAWITPPLAGVLPQSVGHAGGEGRVGLEVLSGIIAVAGILLAAWLYLGRRSVVKAIGNSAPGRFLTAWWYAAWGFDWLYDKVFVQPYLWLTRVLARDPLDRTIGILPLLARGGHALLSRSENGQIRWYAASIAGGAVLVIGILLLSAV